MQVLLSGDPFPCSSTSTATAAKVLQLGPGLTSGLEKGKGKERELVSASRAGLLGHVEQGEKDKWWIEGTLKRQQQEWRKGDRAPERSLTRT
ncbi:hypothetical protein JCM6882_000628 [Rhodosporidiobolus microsporus]